MQHCCMEFWTKKRRVFKVIALSMADKICTLQYSTWVLHLWVSGSRQYVMSITPPTRAPTDCVGRRPVPAIISICYATWRIKNEESSAFSGHLSRDDVIKPVWTSVHLFPFSSSDRIKTRQVDSTRYNIEDCPNIQECPKRYFEFRSRSTSLFTNIKYLNPISS